MLNQKKPKIIPQVPEVIFQPKTYRNMQRGIAQMVNAIRPTLGPLPRTVAIERQVKPSKPELLDSGGVIARRVIQIRNRDEDMGAMFIRHVLWEMYEKVGDGTATTAVLFQAIFDRGVRYIAAGGNAMRLRIFLEEAGRVVVDELEKMTFHLEGKEALSQLALTICHDPELANKFGEIFDVIGDYGRLEIRTGRSRELEREYIEGMYWDGGLVSRTMINDLANVRAYFEDVPIFISNLDIKEPQDFIPILQLSLNNQITRMVVMAGEVSDRSLSILLEKANREKVEIVVVKSPGVSSHDRRAAMEDLAILTGALPLHKEAGDLLAGVTLENLGKARRVWANLHTLVLIGGKGDPRRLRQHIASLRSAHANTKDADERKRFLERIGKLLGGSATLWVGDTTPLAVEARKELAEHTAEAMRGSIREGVVAGGGTALLDCRTVLKAQIQDNDEEERRVAFTILHKALEEPIRVLLENAGLDSRDVLAELRQVGPGWGYDILHSQIVNMTEAGICDSASVIRQAVFSAVHSAALALTTDVLVHRRIRPESISKTG